jgi:hypothetical protein
VRRQLGALTGGFFGSPQVQATTTQRKRLKQLHWDKIRTVPENSVWSKTPKVRIGYHIIWKLYYVIWQRAAIRKA